MQRLLGKHAYLLGDIERTLGYGDFRAYQKWMAKKSYRMDALCLAAHMGLGKTGAALKAIQKLLDDGVVKKFLIIAPLNVAINTWPDEIYTWRFAHHLSFSVLCGDKHQREAARREKTQIHIINPNNIRWLIEQWGAKWPYDALVYDEASRMKAANTFTKPAPRKDGTKAPRRLSEWALLCKKRRTFKKVIELSGTLSPNGLQDLYGPTYLLDGGKRLGKSKYAFLNRWFVQDRYSYEWVPRANAEQEIMDRISDVFFVLRKEDYLDLPPVQINDVVVDMPSATLKRYKRFERNLALEVNDNSRNKKYIEAMNRGVLANKLLQFANGSVYDEDKNVHKIHNLKLDALSDIVENEAGQNILVAYSYKFDLAAIKKRFPHVRVFGDSPSDAKDWNKGRIRMMALHPASAAHGLNFQYGGHIAVWFGLIWSLELYQQLNARLARPGQESEYVILHRILTRGTYDMRQADVLEVKGINQSRVNKHLRVYMEDIRRAA